MRSGNLAFKICQQNFIFIIETGNSANAVPH